MKVGVLALQGDFDAHRRRLEELGAEVVLVKKPEQLDEVEALIIPGGESSTFLWHLEERGFLEKLRDFVRAKPTFGTCAGAILLARIPRVVFGAWDEKAGMVGSVEDLLRHPRLNHRPEVRGGVLAEECARLIEDFFTNQRTAV